MSRKDGSWVELRWQPSPQIRPLDQTTDRLEVTRTQPELNKTRWDTAFEKVKTFAGH